MTINLEFPGACEVTQEHQNEIIISVIFKLKEGSQSTDEENRVILKPIHQIFSVTTLNSSN